MFTLPDSARIRVLGLDRDLAYLVDGPTARGVLDTGAFRTIRRGKVLRCIVPRECHEEMAAAVLADLEGLIWDNGPVVRCGYSHTRETWENPARVVTISRIPKSLRPIFTRVVDSCAA